MDSIDKNIVFFLLKDSRMPQRQIAKSIGISAQTLNYRMTRLIEDGVIKNFGIRVNPAIYGKIEGYAAFLTDKELKEGYTLILKCLEKKTLYGFVGDSEEDVISTIEKSAEELGEPIMKCIPSNEQYSGNSRSFDNLILNQLKKTPREKLSVIAKTIDIPSIRVKRRYNFLKKSNIAAAYARIDLSKTGGVVFIVVSHSPEKVEKILENITFLKFLDSSSGFFVSFADNISEVKNLMEIIRKVEKDSEAMMVYDYDFKSE